MYKLLALLALLSLPAFAVTLTITDGTCTLSGNVLTCKQPVTPPVDPPVTPPTDDLANCARQGFFVLPLVTATWGKPQTWYSTQSGAFGDNVVWLFKLTVPAGTPASTVNGNFGLSEYGGPNTLRQMTISKTPCDFRGKDYTGANGPYTISNGTSVQVNFTVAGPQIFGGLAGLTAGQTYYVSVRNWQLDPTPQPSCGQASCNAIMSMQAATP